MNCVNHQNTQTETACKNCGRVFCADCMSVRHKFCYECAQQEYNFSKGVLFKRIIPWMIIGISIFILLIQEEQDMSIGLSVIISYLVFCLPWMLFATRDARLRGALLSIRTKPRFGLDSQDIAQASNSMWIFIKSFFVAFFIVPGRVIANIINFFRMRAILGTRNK